MLFDATSIILGIIIKQQKANDNIEQQDQKTMTKKMMSGNFTLKDFASQMDMMGRLGSLQKIARYMPGMGSVSPEMMEKGQEEMKFFRAIISSMTDKERLMPAILDGSRKLRIAKGAGVNVENINQLLQKFEQSKQFVKMFKKRSGFGKFFR